jgi:hypothetical protein
MRKMLLTALLAAVLTGGGLLAGQRSSMAFVAPSALHGLIVEFNTLQKATKVCGPYGCVRVYRPFTYLPYYGYYRSWDWSDVGHPTYHVPYYGFYRPWDWSGVGR